jgi:hypothetical protein
MKVIRANHVDDALCQGLQWLADAGVIEETARGPVIVAATPVTTCFIHPMNNASLCPIRDANPFFHLIEALWMLSGQSDARMLDPYIKGFSTRVAEKDGHDHGAYGWRWRQTFGFDQIEYIIRMLKEKPDTRQAVLQMWDCSEHDDGLEDLTGGWNDRPCNTHVYFRIIGDEYLDMTVCNRSNDIIWGTYGANAVHFSFLLQYMASRLGLKANSYYQMSNNFHAYLSEIDRLWARTDDIFAVSIEQKLIKIVAEMHRSRGPIHPDYAVPNLDLDLSFLQSLMDNINQQTCVSHFDTYSDFGQAMLSVAQAHKEYREGYPEIAAAHINEIPWSNWREACLGWLQRRVDAKARRAMGRELVPGE